MNKILLLSLAAAVTLTACEQAEPQTPVQTFPVSVEQALSGMEFARAPGEDDIIEATKGALAATIRVASKTSTWQEAHEAAQREIQGAEPGIHRSQVEQALSKLMLAGYLIPNSKSEGASEAALHYSALLVERESPETEVVFNAVQEFDRAWPTQRAQAIANEAADVGERYVEVGRSCVGCGADPEIISKLNASGRSQDVTDAKRLKAVAQLRELTK